MFALRHRILLIVAAVVAGASLSVDLAAAVRFASPSTYRELVRSLEAGDRLVLAEGVYRNGLRVHDLHGAPGMAIVIEGEPTAGPVVFIGRPGRNIVSIRDSSHVVIRHMEIDGRGAFVDGVKAEGDAGYAHHIMLEDLYIHSLAKNQQSVGISTKCPNLGLGGAQQSHRGCGYGHVLRQFGWD
jgi:hypothetical protein